MFITLAPVIKTKRPVRLMNLAILGAYPSVPDGEKVNREVYIRRHDTQQNGTQQNDIQHSDTQHNGIQHNDTQHNDNL